jgi:hypothetical protein
MLLRIAILSSESLLLRTDIPSTDEANSKVKVETHVQSNRAGDMRNAFKAALDCC